MKNTNTIPFIIIIIISKYYYKTLAQTTFFAFLLALRLIRSAVYPTFWTLHIRTTLNFAVVMTIHVHFFFLTVLKITSHF